MRERKKVAITMAASVVAAGLVWYYVRQKKRAACLEEEEKEQARPVVCVGSEATQVQPATDKERRTERILEDIGVLLEQERWTDAEALCVTAIKLSPYDMRVWKMKQEADRSTENGVNFIADTLALMTLSGEHGGGLDAEIAEIISKMTHRDIPALFSQKTNREWSAEDLEMHFALFGDGLVSPSKHEEVREATEALKKQDLSCEGVFRCYKEKDPEACLGALATICFVTNRVQEAKGHISDHAKKVGKNVIDTVKALCIHIEEGDFEGGLRKAELLDQRHPGDDVGLVGQAECLAACGHYEFALKKLDAVSSETPYTVVRRGSILFATEDEKTAEYCQKMIGAYRGVPFVVRRLNGVYANMLLQNKENDRKCLDYLRGEREIDAAALCTIAKIEFEQTGKLAQPVSLCQEAIELSPMTGGMALSDFYFHTGKIEESVRVLERILDLENRLSNLCVLFSACVLKKANQALREYSPELFEKFIRSVSE
ncbi:MAG: uncharacterized protein A8A55_0212 [Amphiamblys sp. WSBS2006]|nr:MAG: uncharacterized protein A8A55_0212 [Amphiamblys sp. WSBS2006]